MTFIPKYLQGFIKFYLNHLIAGSKGEASRIHGYYSLKTAVLKNKKLAAELEDACRKNSGALTFAEYLSIDQFGTHGYHTNSKYHGEQRSYEFWAEALVRHCVNNNISNIIDFGPGNGNLGIHALKYGNKIKKTFTWSGIEINKDLRKVIKEGFQKEKLIFQLKYLVSSLDKLPVNQKSATVFSYSLDNLSPEMLINTTRDISFPTAIMGVTISGNVLHETIFTNDQLRKKGVHLKNGIFTDNRGQSFDITAWKLKPLQRACIPLPAATILTSLTKRLVNGSSILIIDEFSSDPYYVYNKHLNIPKDLTAYYRHFEDLNDLYRTSGDSLLYFPTYANAYLKILKSLGFSGIDIGFQDEIVNKLAENKIKKPSKGLCLAITGIKKRLIKSPVAIGSYATSNLVKT